MQACIIVEHLLGNSWRWALVRSIMLSIVVRCFAHRRRAAGRRGSSSGCGRRCIVDGSVFSGKGPLFRRGSHKRALLYLNTDHVKAFRSHLERVKIRIVAEVVNSTSVSGFDVIKRCVTE